MTRRRIFTAALRIAAVVSGLAVAIELGARWNIRREQQRREPLGDRLFTEVAGSRGNAVVFLAGLQGSTRYWDHAFDELAKHDRRVIYVDLLGFGRSPWPDVDYTLEDHLAWLRRTLVGLGATDDVTLVGHSFGTIVAAHYAERHPDEIAKLILLGTPVFDSEEEARRRIWEMSPLAAMFSLRPLLARETCLLMESLRPLFRRAMPRLMPDLPPAVAEDTVLHTWWSFRGALKNVLLTKPIARPLRAVGARTTLVHGRRDTITPLPRIHSLARETGAAVVEANCDHHGYVREERAAILELIRP